MLRRSLILLMLSLSMVGCARFHTHPKTTEHPQKIEIPGFIPQNQMTYQPAFNRIKIVGPFQVKLHTQRRSSNVTFHGNQNDLNQVKWYVANRQLIILAQPQKKAQLGQMYLDIDVSNLTSFDYQGSGAIVAQSLHAKSLDLSIQNNSTTRLEGSFTLHSATFSGRGKTAIKGLHGQIGKLSISDNAKVQIHGIIQLCNLNMKNHAWLSAYWISSHALKIRLHDQACAQLAGTVDILDAALFDRTRFNGRYLRVRDAFVKTAGQSEADINVIEAQHTLATNNSNIYFYDLPDMRADFMAENGSVLDLREWERPFFRESRRY